MANDNMKKRKFMIVNITWNSMGWVKPTHEPSNFAWVKENPNKDPGESWNFSFGESKTKHGFFQFKAKPRYFADSGIIFFFSKYVRNNKNYIVGLYAKACVHATKSKHYISAPTKYCIKLPNYLPFNRERYLPIGRKRIPQCNYTYIDLLHAKRILQDAIRFNRMPRDFEESESPQKSFRKLVTISKLYFPDIEVPRFKTRRVNKEEYLEFIKKEIPNFKSADWITIKKNNAKLKDSFSRHECLVNKFIDEYLNEKKYRKVSFKNADIVAKKGSKILIIEVKSCTDRNITAQVKNAISQLYYYQFVYEKSMHSRGNQLKLVLVMEKMPPIDLCNFVTEFCGIELWYKENKVLVRYTSTQ